MTSRWVSRILVAAMVAAAAAATMAMTIGAAADAAPVVEAPSDDLTVVMTELQPFIIDDGGRADGFYAEIWDEVADRLGVDYEVVWVDSFPELLDFVEQGRAEVAVAPLAPTADREATIDFTSAVIGSGPQLGYHRRTATRGSVLAAVLSGPVRQILVAAVLGLVILAHLIWLVERNRTDDEGGDFDHRYLRGVWDGFWWATVTVTTVGYGDKAPRSVGGRLIALLAMSLSLFLVGAFVSQVTEVLQESRVRAPVSTLDDARGRVVGAVAGSSFAAFVEAEGVEVRGYDTQIELLEAVENGDLDLLVTNPYALATIASRHGVEPAGELLYREFETFGVAQGSPWREPINQVLADLTASGEIDEIVNRWMASG